MLSTENDFINECYLLKIISECYLLKMTSLMSAIYWRWLHQWVLSTEDDITNECYLLKVISLRSAFYPTEYDFPNECYHDFHNVCYLPKMISLKSGIIIFLMSMIYWGCLQQWASWTWLHQWALSTELQKMTWWMSRSNRLKITINNFLFICL